MEIPIAIIVIRITARLYEMGSYTEMWKSLELCMGIFRMVSKEVAQCLNYLYPDYDKNISNYVIRQKEKYQR